MKNGLRRLARKYPTIRRLLSGPLALRNIANRRLNRRVDDVLRRAAEFIVEDVTINVPEFNGQFLVSPKSHLFSRMLRHGSYEPEYSAQFLSHVRPGMDVVDVGANVGFYTVAAAKLGGRVLAIEPTPGAFRRLEHNVAKNRVVGAVVAFNGLASDKAGERELHIVEDMEEYSSMSPIRTLGIAKRGAQSEVVAARTIDSLVAEYGFSPSLMKVDTEGAELLVFRGARETLSRHRPIVLSELSNSLLSGFGATGDDVLGLFRDLGYDIRSGSGEPLSAGADGYGEILCLPGT